VIGGVIVVLSRAQSTSVKVAPLLAWLKNRSSTAQTERQLAGEPADHLRALADLAEGVFEQVGIP